MNRTLAGLLLLVGVLAPGAASAAVIAEQPDNSSTRVINTTLFSHQIELPPFTATQNYSLGPVALMDENSHCSASSTGSLKFSANIPVGSYLYAYVFHDTATPTPHGTNYVVWGDLHTCIMNIPGNGVMTDYTMPISVPPVQYGTYFPDLGILNGNTYHLILGEVAGNPMTIEFKSDPTGKIYYQLSDVGNTTATTTQESRVPVIVIPGILGSAQHNGTWVIDPITHGYDNLINTLVANGYVDNESVFTFAYDWHLSNVTSATLLRNKIEEVKDVCHCSKVDIVAHSMGGLIARQYIQSTNFQHDVRKIVFLGTPHAGSPKAYLMWQGGEPGTGTDDQALKMFLTIDARKHGYSSLFDYEHNRPIPSVQELLPVYGYIKHAGSSDIPAFPNDQWYPNNLFLYDLNANMTALLSADVEVTNIVGKLTGDTTVNTIRVTAPSAPNKDLIWGFGEPENFKNPNTDQGLELGDGDGTVPVSSSALISNNVVFINAKHTSLPTAAEGNVFKALTGDDAAITVQDDIGGASILKNVLLFQILSPADIQIIAPDGRRVGKDFVSGTEINEIPDAFYSGFETDDEYVTIANPISGEYKIITQGTGSGGAYTLVTGISSDATSSVTYFSGTTTPALFTEHRVNVNAFNSKPTEIQPTDQLPPLLEMIQPATSTFTHSEILPIKINANDETGISYLDVKFDSKPIAASSTIDLFFEALGKHTLSISAADLVGNSTSTSLSVFVVATASSTQKDIEHTYALGWITSKDLKNLLLAQMNQVTKWKSVSTSQPVPGNPKKTQTVTKIVKVIDTILLKVMLAELQAAKSLKQLNLQGYQILTNDITWLINN